MELRERLEAIAEDAQADALRYEGMPLTGRTAATITGEQNAMIGALASSMIEVLDMIEGKRLTEAGV